MEAEEGEKYRDTVNWETFNFDVEKCSYINCCTKIKRSNPR